MDNDYTGLEIAVIGMAGEFPGAKDLVEYWDNLLNGVESITHFTDEELLERGVSIEEINNKDFVKSEGVLKDHNYFDFEFFNYSPNEAKLMDPQMRKLHEYAWKTLEDAGYFPSDGERTIGLFAGASSGFMHILGTLISSDALKMGHETRFLNDKDLLTSRVAYNINLRGPSYTLNTACSTSLVAVHVACQSILNGECDIALAGGVTIKSENYVGYLYQEGVINSKDGHCRPFDINASGTVRADGIGLVALKKLEEAIADNDNIYAIIKGSAINNDGNRKIGYTAPSVDGQVEVIKTAQFMAGVESQKISFLECHGTGTSLGDSIEIESLKLAFNGVKKNSCAIGAVKSNIGHTDSAAGIAGFIKTVLALKNEVIPPSPNFEIPNPKLRLEESPFYINKQAIEWKNDTTPRYSGVTSLGIGGTNAHVILEQAPQSNPINTENEWNVILLSARNKDSLDQYIKNLSVFLENNSNVSISDIAYTLQIGRKPFEYRKTFICKNNNELLNQLKNNLNENFCSKVDIVKRSKKVFVFSGQGSQYANMGKELYYTNSIYKNNIDACCDTLWKLTGQNYFDILFPSNNDRDNDATSSILHSGPLKFITEYSATQMLIPIVGKPDYLIGHSFGEYVAACIAGVFTVEEALKMIVERGKLMAMTDDGCMMLVTLSEIELKRYLTKEISLASVNSEDSCIVSGEKMAILRLEKDLTTKGIECLIVNFPKASHSHLMKKIVAKFENEIASTNFNKPLIPYISGLTGTWIRDEEACSISYWGDHLTNTIRFSDGVKELLKEKDIVFIQPGCDKGLIYNIKQLIPKNNYLAINILRGKKDETSDVWHMCQTLSQLWLYGLNITWGEFFENTNRKRISLPTYPFQKKYFPLGEDPNKQFKKLIKTISHNKHIKLEPKEWFYQPSWAIAHTTILEKENLKGKKILLFTDNSKFAEILHKQIVENEGIVYIVKKGITYFASQNYYEIDIDSIFDFYRLFNDLDRNGGMPDKIIHLFQLSLYKENICNEDVLYSLKLGFNCLFNIVKSLVNKLDDKQKIQIYTFSNFLSEVYNTDSISSEKSIILGLIRSIPREYPTVKCKNIDIPYTDGISQFHLKEIVERSLEELIIIDKSSNQIVAFRDNQRYIQVFQKIYLESEKTLPTLKYGGTYIIIGGFGENGGIGFIIAKYLAMTVKANIIIISRTELPIRGDFDAWLGKYGINNSISKKILMIRELEIYGANVFAFSSDISSSEQTQDLFNKIYTSFSKIDGIFHAAAQMNDESMNYISEVKDAHIYQNQFLAKVLGTINLYNAIKNKEYDFCILMSSVSSIFGPSAAYSGANNFLDSFTNSISKLNNKNWISINWDIWQKYCDTPSNYDIFSISASEGIDVIEKVLKYQNIRQIIVSTGDLETRIDHLFNRVNVTSVNAEHQKFIFTPVWEKEFHKLNIDTIPELSENWIVFDNKSKLATSTIAILKESKQNISIITKGKEYLIEDNGYFTINNQDPTHFERLFIDIEKQECLPTRMIYFWNSFHEKWYCSKNFESDFKVAMFELSHLYEVIHKYYKRSKIKIGFIVEKNQSIEDCCYCSSNEAAILDLTKGTFNQFVNVFTVNVDAKNINSENNRIIAQNIIDEFKVIKDIYSDIAYMNDFRYTLNYKRTELSRDVLSHESLFEGIYVIINGLSDIGFNIASYLVKEYSAKVLIIDQLTFPARETWEKYLEKSENANNPNSFNVKIKTINRIEQQSKGLYLFDSDINNFISNVQNIQNDYGPISGIFNCLVPLDFDNLKKSEFSTNSSQDFHECFQKQFEEIAILGTIKCGFKVNVSTINSHIFNTAMDSIINNITHKYTRSFSLDGRKNGEICCFIDWRVPSEQQNLLLENESIKDFNEGKLIVGILKNGLNDVIVSDYDSIIELRKYNPLNNKHESCIESVVEFKNQRPDINTVYKEAKDQKEKDLVVLFKDIFGYERIGCDDSFFDLGGNSLQAIQLITKIRRKFNVKLTLVDFYKSPTITKLIDLIDQNVKVENLPKVCPTEKKEYYPVTSMQKSFYYLQSNNKNSIAYNELITVANLKNVNFAGVKKILNVLVSRHEILRAFFDFINGEICMRIRNDFELEILEIQIDDINLEDAINEFIKPFNMQGPLFRVGLFYLKNGVNRMFIDIHHIIVDENSKKILKDEINLLINEEHLKNLELQFKDYSTWRNSSLLLKIQKQQEKFWMNELSGDIEIVDLPTDYERPIFSRQEGRLINYNINQDLNNKVKNYVRKNDINEFAFILGVYKLLIYKLTNAKDICIGMPVSERKEDEVFNLIGPLINQVVIRSNIDVHDNIANFFSNLKSKILTILDNREYPFFELVSNLKIRRMPNRLPVTDIGFSYINVDMVLNIENQGDLALSDGTAKGDVALTVFEYKNCIDLFFQFDKNLFKDESIKSFVSLFAEIMNAILENDYKQIQDIKTLKDYRVECIEFDRNKNNFKF